MKSSGTNYSYIVRNPYSYCFRMNVPQDLQRFFGKRELRYTLKTGRLGIAKKKSRYLAGQVQAIFRVIRKGNFLTVDETDIKELVNKYIKQSVERINNLFNDGPGDDILPYTNEPEFYSYLSELDSIRDELISHLNMSNWEMLEGEIINFLQSQGIKNIDKSSEEYQRLCSEIHQAQIKLLPIEIRHRKMDFSYKEELPEIFPEVFESKKTEPVPVPDPPKEKPSKPLEVAIKEYSKENERAGNWSKRTMIEYRSIFKNILRLLGNVPVNTIDRQSALDFKQTLLAVPADYFKATKKYEKIPLSEAIKSKPKKTLTAKTVNKYITNLSAILNYACDHGYTETNYASNIKIRLKGKASKERDQFSNKDLAALFHSKEYIEDMFDVPWKFWLPLLGLFTGCRIEELCQLALSDVKQEHGIWVLDVKEDLESDKKTKTESSNRLVPLHPFIIKDLNFIGYINHLKKMKETRLFPELKKQSERLGHYPSRWFGTYKKKCGIISKPNKKVFHSFRHNLQDNLKQQLIPTEIIDELVGHTHEGQTLGRYTEQYKIQTLFEKGIMKLDYGIDLSHLKDSKYVPKNF